MVNSFIEFDIKYILLAFLPSQHFHVGYMWVCDLLSLGPCMGNPNGAHRNVSIGSTRAC